MQMPTLHKVFVVPFVVVPVQVGAVVKGVKNTRRVFVKHMLLGQSAKHKDGTLIGGSVVTGDRKEYAGRTRESKETFSVEEATREWIEETGDHNVMPKLLDSWTARFQISSLKFDYVSVIDDGKLGLCSNTVYLFDITEILRARYATKNVVACQSRFTSEIDNIIEAGKTDRELQTVTFCTLDIVDDRKCGKVWEPVEHMVRIPAFRKLFASVQDSGRLLPPPTRPGAHQGSRTPTRPGAHTGPGAPVGPGPMESRWDPSLRWGHEPEGRSWVSLRSHAVECDDRW